MPRRLRVPSYRLHRASGQAVVTLNGRDHYLGRHDTPESRLAYERLVAEWLGSGRCPVVERSGDLTLVEALDAYWQHARVYYRGPDGKATSQQDRVRRALKPAMDLYGTTPAREFAPGRLKAVRARMVEQKLCRRVVNQRVDCLKRAFKWLVSEDLVPVEVYQALRAVDGLRRGRTEATDHEPVKPVLQAHLDLTLPLLRPFLRDVCRLQLLTAARPGEVLQLEPALIERRGSVWIYQPGGHKTAWRGHQRVLFLGPRAQELIGQYLLQRCPVCGTEGRAGRYCFRGPLCGPCSDRVDEEERVGVWPLAELLPEGRRLFSPREAEEERNTARRARRKTPVQPSQQNRATPNRKRPPGAAYLPTSLSHAVRHACLKAGVPLWHPHQLRHNAATEIVAQFGWEVARIVLGHRVLDATRIYGEDDMARAIEAMRKFG